MFFPDTARPIVTSFLADDLAHWRIRPEPLGVIHAFVPREKTTDRLSKEVDHAVPVVLRVWHSAARTDGDAIRLAQKVVHRNGPAADGDGLPGPKRL